MTPADLLRIMPQAGRQADAFARPLADAMERYNIVGPVRQAMFLSQIGVESGQLTRMVESLNYTPDAIIATFNTKVQRFTRAQADEYGRTPAHAANQRMIGSIAYANRMGNGNVASGDGYNYRGRGLLQITGRDNYERCGQAIGFGLVANPAFLETPRLAAESAGWFWSANGLNRLADEGSVEAVTKKVNGGHHALAQRRAMYELARKVLT